MIVITSVADRGQFEETRLDTTYVIEYDILRVILTILVVVGHAAYISHVTPYGGCDYSVYFPSDEKSSFFQIAFYISMLIYLFHMPLFMSLSGALFYRSFENKKYHSLKTLLIEKGKKLLIPFFVVGALYSFPIKLLAGYYSKSENLLWDFIIGQLLIRADTHLWFLLTLFCIFLISYLLEKYWTGHLYCKIGLMFCAYVINRLLGWRWQSPMEMTLWF